MDKYLQAFKASHDSTLTVAALEEEVAYTALIRALPDEFATFRSSLLLVNADKLTYDKIKTAFLQEEQARQASAAEIALRASTSNASSSNRKGKPRAKKFEPCSYPGCKAKSREGHSTERCVTIAVRVPCNDDVSSVAA